MIEKIGIRFLTQFLIIGIMRLFVLDGRYSLFNLSVMFMCMLYALIITVFMECFDQWVIHYSHHYYHIIIAIMMICGVIIYLGDSMFHSILFGYLLVILVKETWQLSTMQLALERYQREYQDK